MRRHQQQFSSVTRFVDEMAIGESIFHLNMVRETPPFKNHHQKEQAVTLTLTLRQKEMISNVCADLPVFGLQGSLTFLTREAEQRGHS